MKRKKKSLLLLALTLEVMLILLIIVLFARKHSEPAQLPHDNDRPIASQAEETATSMDVLENDAVVSTHAQNEEQPHTLSSQDGMTSTDSFYAEDYEEIESESVDIDSFMGSSVGNDYGENEADPFERF